MLKRLQDDERIPPALRVPLVRAQRTLSRQAAMAIRLVWSWKRAVAAGLTALALLVFVVLPAILGPRVSVDPVVRGDLIKTVVASGHVEAPFRATIASQIVGVVSKVAVSEGDTVKSGQPLIYLDDRETRTAVSAAEGAVAQFEARLRQMRELTLPSAQEALVQAQATLKNAQQSYDRASSLARTGAGTKAALDDATRGLDVARAAVRSAEVQVFTSQPGGSDYVMAETLLSQAKANLETANSRLSYTVITAPRDGVLIARNVEVGDVVQPGASLLKLSPFGDTELVAQIDEKNLALLSVGQQALASADAYPRQTFRAEVVYINTGVDLQSATVEVKLRVGDPPPYLKQDMTVSIDIEVARSSQALVAKAADINELGGEHPWVLDVSSGRAVRRQVKLGLSDAGRVEILSGIDEKSLLVPASNTAIAEGQRVRAIVSAKGPAS